jgi:hypothetical protein
MRSEKTSSQHAIGYSAPLRSMFSSLPAGRVWTAKSLNVWPIDLDIDLAAEDVGLEK